MEKSHVVGETRDRFMAIQMSLDSEKRIVVNIGRRTFQEERNRKLRYWGRKPGWCGWSESSKSSLERQGGGSSTRRQARQEWEYESLYRGWVTGVHTRILVNKTCCRCFLTWRVLYLTFFKDEKLKNKMTKQESEDWKLELQCINLEGTTDIQALTHEHGKNARVFPFCKATAIILEWYY